jgi:hypothetical protein
MNYWSKMAKSHWEKFLPRMYKKYQEQGTLDQELRKAGQRAEEMLGELIESGLRRNEALEIVLPQVILLPPESDLPAL